MDDESLHRKNERCRQNTIVQPSFFACSWVYETPSTFNAFLSKIVIKPPLFPSWTVGGSDISCVHPASRVPERLALFFILSAICQSVRSIDAGEALSIVTVSFSGAGPTGLTRAAMMQTA